MKPINPAEILSLINLLREGEGSCLTINCPNPDGPPNEKVEVCGEWTDWEFMSFSGDTLTEALKAAAKARSAMEGKPIPHPSAVPARAEYRMPWGKHKGETLSNVPTSYLDWLLGKDDIPKVMREEITAHLSRQAEYDKEPKSWKDGREDYDPSEDE